MHHDVELIAHDCPGVNAEKQMEYGKAAQQVCPIRIEYSFKVTHEDGRVENTSKGAGETHFFYLNAFDEWTFKVGK